MAAATPEPYTPTETGDSAADRTPASFTAGRLAVALTVAGLLGWAILSFTPKLFTIPESLRSVQPNSPPAEQAKLAAKEAEIRLGNGLTHFLVLGLAFGLVPLILGQGARAELAAAAGIATGLAGGAAAYLIGARLRDLIDSGYAFPQFGGLGGDLGESIQGDVLVFGLVGLCLSLPLVVAMLMFGGKNSGERACMAPVAGLMAGLLFPALASFLVPSESTQKFPIQHAGLLALWLAIQVLLSFLFISAIGDKKQRRPKVEPAMAPLPPE